MQWEDETFCFNMDSLQRFKRRFKSIPDGPNFIHFHILVGMKNRAWITWLYQELGSSISSIDRENLFSKQNVYYCRSQKFCQKGKFWMTTRQNGLKSRVVQNTIKVKWRFQRPISDWSTYLCSCRKLRFFTVISPYNYFIIKYLGNRYYTV